jgi:hypothetical protein
MTLVWLPLLTTLSSIQKDRQESAGQPSTRTQRPALILMLTFQPAITTVKRQCQQQKEEQEQEQEEWRRARLVWRSSPPRQHASWTKPLAATTIRPCGRKAAAVWNACWVPVLPYEKKDHLPRQAQDNNLTETLIKRTPFSAGTFTCDGITDVVCDIQSRHGGGDQSHICPCKKGNKPVYPPPAPGSCGSFHNQTACPTPKCKWKGGKCDNPPPPPPPPPNPVKHNCKGMLNDVQKIVLLNKDVPTPTNSQDSA